MKILFFGTPVFAEIVLQKLLESNHQVVGVVCQTDKPSGRGNKVLAPHIKEFAIESGIKVFQPEKLKEHVEDFKAIGCDIGVTASYGKIIPKSVLQLFPIVNVHPSMLPKYRGATPIQSAVLNGDVKTGVTIMKTDVGIDDGDIYVQEEVEILPEDDYSTLEPKLADIGAKLLIQTLDKIETGTAVRNPQNHAKATFVKMISKEDALVDFGKTAEKIVNKVRAFCTSPVAYFFVGGVRVKVQKAKVISIKQLENFGIDSLDCGQIYTNKKHFFVGAKDGAVEILRCQAAGGKMLDAAAFLNGFHFSCFNVDAVEEN